jgi:hypothetical protein
MTNDKISENGNKTIKLDWHAGFFDAVRADLTAYAHALSFEREHYLNAEALRIDVLVIKKQPGIVIKKNFAEHFKGHNILEFKGPDDSLTMTDYLKVICYGCLYQSVESVSYTDITLTMVCTMHPNK